MVLVEGLWWQWIIMVVEEEVGQWLKG